LFCFQKIASRSLDNFAQLPDHFFLAQPDQKIQLAQSAHDLWGSDIQTSSRKRKKTGRQTRKDQRSSFFRLCVCHIDPGSSQQA